LQVAVAAASAFDYIGFPEGVYPIAEATLYLATAPKSNSVGAYFKALEKVTGEGAGPVPVHLMDSSRDARGLGHGQGYQYPHNFPGHYTPQQYLPDGVEGTRFFEPSTEGYEAEITVRLEEWRRQFDAWFAARQPKTAQEGHGSHPADPAR
jgi:putative ATPase